MRIAFVCTGNICRSPLAEALARHHAERSGLTQCVQFESFGTHDYHVGEAADRRTIATARELGVDLSRHRARRIRPNDCAHADLLLAMDGGHEQHLRRLAPVDASGRIHLYLPWLEIDGHRDVPDPYYGDREGFLTVHELLDGAARRLVERLPDLLASEASR